LNRDTLSQLIKNPSSLTSQHEAELKQMLKVYPYFQALFVLYAKATPSPESIEKAAVRTLDRNLLRKIITKNFNPNATDAFGALLKNTEQVNAFEKLRAEAKEEKRKAEKQETSIHEVPEAQTKPIIVSFDDEESAASIVYNNQNEFSSLTQTETLPASEDKGEPTYNPFATDIFDKDLSTNEIVIDEDVKLQTNIDYNDELIKPISYKEIETKVEEPTQYQSLKNHISSTDNFFEETIFEVEDEVVDTAQSQVKETKSIDNFFDVPDFDLVEIPSVDDAEDTALSEPVIKILDAYQIHKEEDALQLINNKLESSFFDLKENLTKPAVKNSIDLLDTYLLRKEEETIFSESPVSQVEIQENLPLPIENNTDLLDTYFLRKEEERNIAESSPNQAQIRENTPLLIEKSIDFLDTYFLRKEEEALESKRKKNEVITNEVAHNEVMTDNVLIASQIDLLDAYYLRKEAEANELQIEAEKTYVAPESIDFVKIDVALLDAYYLRKEEEALQSKHKKNEVITNEVAHNEVMTDNVLIASQIDLLDAYYLRKEAEANELQIEAEKMYAAFESIDFVKIDVVLLDAYYLRKEEEALQSKHKKNEVITNEVAHNELMTDNVLIASQIDLLDAYYLRKEAEAHELQIEAEKTHKALEITRFINIDVSLLDTYYLRKEEEAHTDEKITQAVSPEPLIEAVANDSVDFFSQISTHDILASETEDSLLKSDEIQFFDAEEEEDLVSFPAHNEVDTDFDTTNFFDDQHHDQPMLITTKPVYKKATQEYQRNLIDKFIKESPAIQIDRNKLASEIVDLAEDSTRENLQIVSESLAKIYASQGRNQKAIEIYQRLSLKNPDKSSYYDTQIKNLEETI
jgi:hypothetical protein